MTPLSTPEAAADMVLISRDRLAELEELARLAYTDELTGLGTRRLLFQQLRLWAFTPRWSIVMLDLDKFKAVNDTLGHAAGDWTIVNVARRLRRDAGKGALVVRHGGDEFAILLPVHEQAARTIVEACIAGISQPLRYQGHSIDIGASAGITAGSCMVRADKLLRRADSALYMAKERRGQAVIWTPNTPDISSKSFRQGQARDDMIAILNKAADDLYTQAA